MKTRLNLSVFIFFIIILASISFAQRQYLDFDFDWKFALGDYADAHHPNFDDSSWKKINVPHDWSIEGPFGPEYASGTGYAPGGVGWYRKNFYLSEANKDKQVFIEFDGVYCNSEVFINGQFVGRRPYGYSSFQYDLTPHLPEYGKVNVIAVRVDHSKVADSRWYTGSGIYRHVRLCMTDKLHIANWGTYITTPDIQEKQAAVKVETKIQNDYLEEKTFSLKLDVIAADGKIVATSTKEYEANPNAISTINSELIVTDHKLWSTANPNLYKLKSTIIREATEVDDTTDTFGIRSFNFDPNKGFTLNGQSMKIKGLCIHHDAGCLGAAVPDKVLKRRLKILKKIGCNAIRTSHNPPAPELLDMCDEMGFLVQDEAFDEFTPAKNKWIHGRNIGLPSRFGYAEYFDLWAVTDLQDMVLRDRNHPSIIMWSIGNEIDYANDPYSDHSLEDNYISTHPSANKMVAHGKKLVTAVKELDTTRPVTAALATVKMSNAVGFADILDIAGYNYQEQYYAADHKKYPNRIIYGSENGDGYSDWLAVRDNEYISGQFLWTGYDYLGEAPEWPTRIFDGGIFDIATFKKPIGYWRQTLWSNKPIVYFMTAEKPVEDTSEDETQKRKRRPHPAEHWNYNQGSQVDLIACTNCQEVIFILNDKEIRAINSNQAKQGWLHATVTYEPGTIIAIGRNDGKECCRYTLRTTDTPSAIKLTADTNTLSADGKDICHLVFNIVDEKGTRIANAENELTFNITGPAKIIGIDNGKRDGAVNYKDNKHNAFEGRGIAIIQSDRKPGKVTIEATSPDLNPATVTLEVK